VDDAVAGEDDDEDYDEYEDNYDDDDDEEYITVIGKYNSFCYFFLLQFFYSTHHLSFHFSLPLTNNRVDELVDFAARMHVIITNNNNQSFQKLMGTLTHEKQKEVSEQKPKYEKWRKNSNSSTKINLAINSVTNGISFRFS
jgi:hypothetical protein